MLSIGDYQAETQRLFPELGAQIFHNSKANLIEVISASSGLSPKETKARYLDEWTGNSCGLSFLKDGKKIHLVFADSARPFGEFHEVLEKRYRASLNAPFADIVSYAVYAHELAHMYIHREANILPIRPVRDIEADHNERLANFKKYLSAEVSDHERARIEEIACDLFSCIKTAERFGLSKRSMLELVADERMLIEYDDARRRLTSSNFLTSFLYFWGIENHYLTTPSLDRAITRFKFSGMEDNASLIRKCLVFAHRNNNLLNLCSVAEDARDIGMFDRKLADRFAITGAAKELTVKRARHDHRFWDIKPESIKHLRLFARRYLQAERRMARRINGMAESALARRVDRMLRRPSLKAPTA